MNVWTIGEGLDLARLCEPVAIGAGYHVALGGSLLHKGWSDKDCDLVLYWRTQGTQLPIVELLARLSAIGLTGYDEEDVDKNPPSAHDSSNKKVVRTYYNGRRVDLIIMMRE